MGSETGNQLYSENLKTFEDPTQYIKAFDAVTRSQQAAAVGGVEERTAPPSASTLKTIQEAARKRGSPAMLTEGGKALGGKFGQTMLRGENVSLIATKTRGPVTFKTVHSTNVKNLLPSLPLKHFGENTVQGALARSLVRRLTELIPDMPVHFVLRADMARIVPNADGVYYASPSRMGKPISEQGPILIPIDILASPKYASMAILHEAIHAATSNIILHNPVAAQKIRTIIDEALRTYSEYSDEIRARIFE